MKLISCIVIGSFALLSNAVFAADKSWTGELYNIVPNKAGITEDYCKSHSLDTYKTDIQDQLKEVIANNGVKAKDLSTRAKQEGGITFYTADVMLSGVADGKAWQDNAYFHYYGLNNKDSPLQGVWYTKNCKGFYKSGPA